MNDNRLNSLSFWHFLVGIIRIVSVYIAMFKKQIKEFMKFFFYRDVEIDTFFLNSGTLVLNELVALDFTTFGTKNVLKYLKIGGGVRYN